jgi:hypothetical protein
MINNTSGSRPSVKVQKLIPIYVYNSSGSLIQSGSKQIQTDVQDSNESLKSFELSRYGGVKVTSLEYNNYSSASASYEGDKSYGKTAAIDHQVRKIGLFSEVVKNKFLPNRNDVITKYLVDEEGNLTELNQRNKNWEEVQRTFITDDDLNISLFDNQKYSNQKSLDGTKHIFESGYSYTPLLYFSGSASTLYFESTIGNTAHELVASHPAGLITSSVGTTPTYPLFTSGSSDRVVYNVFTNITTDINSSAYYNIGSTGSQTHPSYSVPETGLYDIAANVSLEISMSNGGSVTWALEVVSGSTVLASSQQSVTIVDQVTGSIFNGQAYTNDFSYTGGDPNFRESITLNGIPYVLEADITVGGTVVFPRGTTVYGYDIYSSISFPTTNCNDCSSCGSCSVSFSNYKAIWGTSSTITFFISGGSCNATSGGGYGSVINCGYYSYGQANLYSQFYEIPGIYNVAETAVISLNINTPQSLTGPTDKFQIRLRQSGLTINAGGNYITRFNTSGNLRIASVSNQINNLPTAIAGGSGFIESTTFTSGSTTSSITLNQQLSSFAGYNFIPNPPTGSAATINVLYPTYGDVDYTFNPGYYDLIVHHNTSGSVAEYRVVNTTVVGGKLVLDIYPSFDNGDKATAFRGSMSKILFLKRLKDETNTIINFIKRDGKTSYGFSIPENIHPDVFKNIDTITREVKSKMLEGGGLDGGTI